jgi:hypothetical protein
VEHAHLHADLSDAGNDISLRVASLELELGDLYGELKTAEFVRCLNSHHSTDQAGSGCSKTGRPNARKQAQKNMKMAMAGARAGAQSCVRDSPPHPDKHEITDSHSEDAGIVMSGTSSAPAVVLEAFAALDG